MGVEYYVICEKCKEYIDIHKAYDFSMLVNKKTPPVGYEEDLAVWNYYWNARAVWFVWKHISHQGVCLQSDANDEWLTRMAFYKELFPHREDLELRKKNEYIRKDGQ